MARRRLAPGTYKLTSDLDNPLGRPRIKTDWMRQMRFKAGDKFLVELEDQGRPKGAVMMKLVRGRGLHLNERDFPYDRQPYIELFRLIADALVPIEEDVEAMFERLSLGMYDLEAFIMWLVERDELPRDRFEKLLTEWCKEVD